MPCFIAFPYLRTFFWAFSDPQWSGLSEIYPKIWGFWHCQNVKNVRFGTKKTHCAGAKKCGPFFYSDFISNEIFDYFKYWLCAFIPLVLAKEDPVEKYVFVLVGSQRWKHLSLWNPMLDAEFNWYRSPNHWNTSFYETHWLMQCKKE